MATSSSSVTRRCWEAPVRASHGPLPRSWSAPRAFPSANLVVFDLHGEYAQLSYARQLRVPGPDDLGSAQADLLYLPFWLMNAEELVAMFVDRSEFTAHNQTLVFQREV